MVNKKSGGFTLIELLVVIIIIGVLASVAIPRYFRSVERTRATEGVSKVAAISHAQERFSQRNGAYATTQEALDVDAVAGKYFLTPTVDGVNARIQRNKTRDGGTTGWPTGCTNDYNLMYTYATNAWTVEPGNCAFVLP
ncbi:MAG: prepilin-type N-terminal cleavage/methylation domain-containing protein [Elusimicrobia bacterium]|nr:prepilin-type N-terminal cleavage/methylation domain-containing protein [Elusimicrobiota bacterium]